MITSLTNHAPQSIRPAHPPEWEEDEVRWETQLRTMAKRPPNADKAERKAVPMSCPQSSLELAAGVTHRDLLFIPRSLPVFTGTEPGNLVCGKCAGVIGCGITRWTARRDHPQGDRLIVRCPCRALNLVFPKSNGAK